MSLRKQKLNRLHYVDEENKVVYVKASSWVGACSTPHWVKRHFGPDYTHMLVSADYLDELRQR